MSYAMLDRYHTAASAPETLITVDAAGGGEYTTIAAALAAASSASITAPYRIYVKNGDYAEIDLTGDDYVTVQGESQAGVVITGSLAECDVSKDVWKINCQFAMQSLTLVANNVKYCVHMDGAGAGLMSFRNVTFKSATGFPVGIGQRYNQIIELIDCEFEKTGANVESGAGSHGIYWHGATSAETAATRFLAQNCTFINCGVAYLSELGMTGHQCLMRFENCVTDDETKGIIQAASDYYYGSGDITTVPYLISPLVIGGTMPLPIAYDAEERPDTPNHWYVI